MIYDRTQEDIHNARILIEEKVKKFVSLNDDEINLLEKACITVNTLNRIEDKIAESKDILQKMGYYSKPFISKNWDSTKIFTDLDFKRITDNISELVKAFFVYSDTPDIPEPVYHFTNINDMEKILYDMERKAKEIKSEYLICGEYISGGAT